VIIKNYLVQEYNKTEELLEKDLAKALKHLEKHMDKAAEHPEKGYRKAMRHLAKDLDKAIDHLEDYMGKVKDDNEIAGTKIDSQESDKLGLLKNLVEAMTVRTKYQVLPV
jgi:soluble cytochrome b562